MDQSIDPKTSQVHVVIQTKMFIVTNKMKENEENLKQREK